MQEYKIKDHSGVNALTQRPYEPSKCSKVAGCRHADTKTKKDGTKTMKTCVHINTQIIYTYISTCLLIGSTY